MINFQRGQDPKEAMGIGRASQRIFLDVNDAAEWCVDHPSVYTFGTVSDWSAKNPKNGLPYFDISKGRFNLDAIEPSTVAILQGITFTGKLQMIKWVKENITFSDWPKDSIGLKYAKDIIDTAEEMIMIKMLKERYKMAQSDVVRIVDFIEETKSIRATFDVEDLNISKIQDKAFNAGMEEVKNFIINNLAK